MHSITQHGSTSALPKYTEGEIAVTMILTLQLKFASFENFTSCLAPLLAVLVSN